MEHHRSSTKREVAIVGQGTWYMEQARFQDSDRRFAPGPRSRHDACRHRGDVRSGAAEDTGREAIEGRRDEVFLVSKVLPDNASRKGTIAACERSLGG